MTKLPDLTNLEIKTFSKFISRLESRDPTALRALKSTYGRQSFAKTICFTGPAGVGKSSLISELLLYGAERGRRLAWLACDPSSPTSGGSILGDRIRLSASKPSLFIRSLSTRGARAASLAIRDIEVFLEAAFDNVWVETAGSGQTQTEISQLSALTVLVLQPETGDEVQWMKSGIREVADAFVINKSDLGRADSVEHSLIEMGAKAERICKVSVSKREGIAECFTMLEKALLSRATDARLKALQVEHSRRIFLERELEKLEKKFQKQNAHWLKNPYQKL